MIVQPIHTCAGAPSTPRQVADRQSWLRRVIPAHIYVTKATEAHEIVNCIRMHFNVQINYESARLAKSSLVKDCCEY